MIATLDRLHSRARTSPLLYRIVLATRCLFAMAFLPTGLVKLLGERFTQVSIESPIGAFFEAMYATGGYWRFLGATQFVAALLLLVPRAATFGALIFFPVALNIFVITVALGFRGTTFVTAPMLAAAGALLAWDWHRLRGVVTDRPPDALALESRAAWVERLTPAWERAAYAVGCAAGLLVFAAVRGLVPPAVVPAALGVGAVAALVALAGVIVALRDRRVAQG